MPSKLFISYRREDTQWPAGRLYGALCNVFGKGNVFRDIEGIPLRVKWFDALMNSLDQSEVVLALIGPQWLNSLDKAGRRRLDDDKDIVRLEIFEALKKGIPVVPVLVDNASLPDRSQLPEDIKELLDGNAEFIRERTFETDVARLIERLGLVSEDSVATTPSATLAKTELPSESNEITSNPLRILLGRFLDRYSRWSFSAARIKTWGSQQDAFASFSGYSNVEIKNELQMMIADGLVDTRKSKTGGTLYRLSKRGEALLCDA